MLIEQSYPGGPYYLSKIADKSLISKPCVFDDVIIKTAYPVVFYVQNEKIAIKDRDCYHLYLNGNYLKDVKTFNTANFFEHRLNICSGTYQGQAAVIYSCDQVNAKAIAPPWEKLFLPVFFTGWRYAKTFTYLPQLAKIFTGVRASFVDRFKRPLNLEKLKACEYLPADLTKSFDEFANLAAVKSYFPIVTDLASAPALASLDLEPGYTDEDLALAESFDSYYVEDTPHGGKHYLIKVAESNVFKYRLTPKLECQVNAYISWYGINARWKKDDVVISDLSNYKVIEHSQRSASLASEPVKMRARAQYIYKMATASGGMNAALAAYDDISDESRADFTALARLWYFVVKRYLQPGDNRPWLLADVASIAVPHRTKHDELRLGVPYLVYLANIIVGEDK